ncbi:MAG: hypothetical protein K9J06_01035 [Flavobacteriales bacterium]|nr:hypothetical protein [Flavobacteriales bacterium]
MNLLRNTSLSLMMVLTLAGTAVAQCSMCRAVTNSGNLAEEGFTPGRGLNDAILYLMAMPYILALLFIIVFFRTQITAWFKGRSTAMN